MAECRKNKKLKITESDTARKSLEENKGGKTKEDKSMEVPNTTVVSMQSGRTHNLYIFPRPRKISDGSRPDENMATLNYKFRMDQDGVKLSS